MDNVQITCKCVIVSTCIVLLRLARMLKLSKCFFEVFTLKYFHAIFYAFLYAP